jgi:hypothetical protein
MTSVADPMTTAPMTQSRAHAAPVATVRDPRLDFFRGVAMFIILLAHTPANLWTRWIPARWGFSDATEMFVFCSGMASAIAFGKLFQTRGLGLGTARITFRIWQVYWAHIGLFVAVAATMMAVNASGFDARDYVGQLNLYPFVNNVEGNLLGLLTLTYVPNYFDILPMYLVILAMIPLVMGLAQIHFAVAAGAVLVIWASANVEVLTLFDGVERTPYELPAQLWFGEGKDRPWFFNPFGWQLCFFTGFALMIGWLPTPPVNKWLIGIAVAVVLGSFLFSSVGLRRFDWQPEWWLDIRQNLRGINSDIKPLRDKSSFGLLRFTHMLSLAYLAWVLVGPMGSRLKLGTVWPRIVGVISKVGQQSLAVFVFSMLLARLLGVALDELSTVNDNGRLIRDPWSNAVVNLIGFAMIIGVAYGAAWYKSQPWRKKQ